MKKRAYGLFCVLMGLSVLAIFSIGNVSGSSEYLAAARSQSIYKLEVMKSRGTIYDCNLEPLVGGTSHRISAVAPTIESVGALEKATGGRERERLAAALSDGKPFLLELSENVNNSCIDSFWVPERYGENQPAAHVIGYVDGAGNGVSGVELAMDDLLSHAAGELSVYYQVDAMGRVIPGASRKIVNTFENSKAGVVLTLDEKIQALAEEAAKGLENGAVVVTEVPGGEIRGLVSCPDFNPADVGASLEGENAPLVNKAFSAYAPGSVFKLATAAAALEAGQGGAEILCTGSVTVDGLTFHCIDDTAHGTVNLRTALEKSCNCYFINAARGLGAQEILGTAYNLGFGSAQEFGRGLFSEKGTVPTAEGLENLRALANFAFGQGELAVTPLQVAGMMNTIASGGIYATPKLISGMVDANKTFTPLAAVTDKQERVMGEGTAARLREFLESASESGTARSGASEKVKTGAKTGTAQTGVFRGEEELLNFWYTGYVRDDSAPRYTITVLHAFSQEDQGKSGEIFRQVAEGIAQLCF